VCEDLGVEMDNFVVAHDDVVRIEFGEAAFVDNNHHQGVIPTRSSMIARVAKTNNVHRTNL
jgi:hypothetical protein